MPTPRSESESPICRLSATAGSGHWRRSVPRARPRATLRATQQTRHERVAKAGPRARAGGTTPNAEPVPTTANEVWRGEDVIVAGDRTDLLAPNQTRGQTRPQPAPTSHTTPRAVSTCAPAPHRLRHHYGTEETCHSPHSSSGHFVHQSSSIARFSRLGPRPTMVIRVPSPSSLRLTTIELLGSEQPDQAAANGALAHEGHAIGTVRLNAVTLRLKRGSEINQHRRKNVRTWLGDVKLATQRGHQSSLPAGPCISPRRGAQACSELRVAREASVMRRCRRHSPRTSNGSATFRTPCARCIGMMSARDRFSKGAAALRRAQALLGAAAPSSPPQRRPVETTGRRGGFVSQIAKLGAARPRPHSWRV